MKVQEIMNSPDENKNLATLLNNSWKSIIKEKVFSDEVSIREMGLANGDSILMNSGEANDDTFLGEIVSFEPGGYLVVANRDSSKDKSKLHLLQIETEKDEDPYKGITYFLAYKDYILFLDSGVRHQTVAKYLEWMITLTHQVTKGVFIKINPEIEIEGNQARLVGATSLEIRPVAVSPTTPIEGYIEETNNKTEIVSDKNTATKILDALNFRYPGFQQYRDHTDGNGLVEVQVRIKLKHKNKLVPVENNLNIADIMEANEDAEFVLVGKGGKTKGKFIRANFEADIDYTGSLMKIDSVNVAFQAALNDFIERGCIT